VADPVEAQPQGIEEQRLWADHETGLESAREQLLHKYLPLARRVAAMLYARRAVDDIEFGDYRQLAYTGLLEAMQRYRYNAETQFATFATYRIRGAILNGIPRMTEVGDQIATHKRMQRERTQSLLEERQRAPSPLAGMLDLIVGIAITLQLDELTESDEPNLLSPNDPYRSCEYDEMQRRIREAVERLPERERKIVHYHYFHHMVFEDIGGLIGLSKSRVSRLHKETIERIRDDLRRSRLNKIC
jgi:RNA polymerase sigma factor for flagellar operon FliA